MGVKQQRASERALRTAAIEDVNMHNAVELHRLRKAAISETKRSVRAKPTGGGGRRRGSTGHSKTAMLARMQLAEGETPVGVQLKLMRAEFKKAYDEEKRVIKDQRAAERASHYADRAAPYVHPRLATVEMVKNIGDSELDQLIAGLAAQAGISLGAGGEGAPTEGPAIEGSATRSGD